jgi:hypothetical protein
MYNSIRRLHRLCFGFASSLCVLAINIASLEASPILIDDFTTIAAAPAGFGAPGQTLVAPGSFNFVDVPGVAGVIGGANATRDTTLNFGAGAGVGSVSLTIAGGDLTYTSTGTAEGSLSLLYTANSTLVVDLTNSATNNVLLVGVGSNSGATTVSATLVDDALNSLTQSLVFAGAGPADLAFPLVGFTGVGLTLIQSILIPVDPSAGGSVSLAGIVVTPESSSIMLCGVMGLALVGYVARGRTRRNSRLAQSR